MSVNRIEARLQQLEVEQREREAKAAKLKPAVEESPKSIATLLEQFDRDEAATRARIGEAAWARREARRAKRGEKLRTIEVKPEWTLPNADCSKLSHDQTCATMLHILDNIILDEVTA